VDEVLEVTLFEEKLKSPLILGSGTLGEAKHNLIEALKAGAGAVTTRTIRVDNTKRKPIRPAYYIEKRRGALIYMLNADNNNLTPWDYWVRNVKEIEKYGPLIVSLSARNPEDCNTIIPAFEANDPPSFFELNFSCPHSARMYGKISYKNVEKALEIIKENTKKPVFLKLSVNNIDYNRLSELESSNLVDAYVISNTLGPGLKIDIKTRKSVLGCLFGGVSGPSIKPFVLRAIYELKQKVEKPIIGVGGIETAEDVLEYLILGCDAVQIYTRAHIEGVGVFAKINKNLKNLLEEMNETVESIKGTFREDCYER